MIPEKVATKRPRFKSNSDRKSTRLNSSHGYISYAVFCLKKKKKQQDIYHYPPLNQPRTCQQYQASQVKLTELQKQLRGTAIEELSHSTYPHSLNTQYCCV